jgi:hypothetical protein
LVDFITITPGFRLSVHTTGPAAVAGSLFRRFDVASGA